MWAWEVRSDQAGQGAGPDYSQWSCGLPSQVDKLSGMASSLGRLLLAQL